MVTGKYYIYFTDNLLLFSTVKEFSKSVTLDEVIAKSLTPRFFLRHRLVYTNNESKTQ